MDLTPLQHWQGLLHDTLCTPWFAALCQRAQQAYEQTTVYPPAEQLFSAFALTRPEQIRVVILGQDPYHEPGQAHGLAFSVRKGVKIPPSLQNICKELQADLHITPPCHGDLTGWAGQGVFLLNSVLTVAHGQAGSHRQLGWQRFTDAVIAAVAQLPQPIAFVLWGAQAQKKEACIAGADAPRLILKSAHPSPLSCYRGFWGSRPFGQCNAFLQAHGCAPIDWGAL